MDKIYVEDLEIYAYHGVNQEEKNMGQRFLISLEIEVDLKEAGATDDLQHTINYAEVCIAIEKEFQRQKYDLIEKAASELANHLLLQYEKIKSVKVKVKKPWAPIGKSLQYAAVEIDRKWHTAYISMGSNIGDRNYHIQEAIHRINQSTYTKVVKQSSIYETKPVGYVEQEDFLNCVIEIKTLLSPEKLIQFLLDIEKELKRERMIKWGPRTIDLDVILYDDCITSLEEITIPHPRMQERMFVLAPLCEIAPYLLHPILNKRMVELKGALEEVETKA